MSKSYLITLSWSFIRPKYIQKHVRKTIEDGNFDIDEIFGEFEENSEILVKGSFNQTKYGNLKELLIDLKTKTVDDIVGCKFYQESKEDEYGEAFLEVSEFELSQNKPKLLNLEIYNEKRNCIVEKEYFSFVNLVKTIESTEGARYYINGLDITKFVKNGWVDSIYADVRTDSALICIEDPIDE